MEGHAPGQPHHRNRLTAHASVSRPSSAKSPTRDWLQGRALTVPLPRTPNPAMSRRSAPSPRSECRIGAALQRGQHGLQRPGPGRDELASAVARTRPARPSRFEFKPSPLHAHETHPCARAPADSLCFRRCSRRNNSTSNWRWRLKCAPSSFSEKREMVVFRR